MHCVLLLQLIVLSVCAFRMWCRQLDGLDRDLEHASGTVEVLNKKVAELIKKSGTKDTACMKCCICHGWLSLRGLGDVVVRSCAGGMKSFVLIVVLVIILIILLFLVIYT